MNKFNYMKKILLTLLGLAVFTACNDDDSPVNSTIDHPISYIELTGNNNQLEYTLVSVKADNERGTIFNNVQIRVDDSFTLEMHIDTDEANAAQIKSGDTVRIVSC